MSDLEHYIRLTFEVEPDDDQYTATCIELGVASCGDTIDEAMANIREAVAVYLEGIEELGERERIFRERGIVIYTSPTPSPQVTLREHVLTTSELVAV